MAASNLVEVGSVSDWNAALRNGTATGRTVVVDFHATWCGPCKTIAPIYSSLAEQLPQVTFLRVDVDKLQPIAQKYKISAMPTFLAIKAGQVVDTLKGADPRGLSSLVARHAGPNPPIAPLPAEAESAKNDGNEAFKAGDWQKAVEAYTKAIEVAPTSAPLYGNRSISFLKLGSEPSALSAALTDAQKAVELLPSWGKGHVRLAEALIAHGRRDEARKALEVAVERSDGVVKKQAQEKLDALR